MTQAPLIQRKLTTILAADAANYSGRMAHDEVGTVQALRRSKTVFETTIAARGGRIANTAGDGLIAEFPSVVEAVAAAVAIQRSLAQTPDLLPFRIGLHLGDVIVEGSDLLGDGVNMAARLQEQAPEGGIYASAQIVDHAKGRLQAEFRPLGPASLKHLGDDIAVFGVLAQGVTPPRDLADVSPQVSRPRAAELAAQEHDMAHAKFRKTVRGYGFAAAGLAFADLMAGPGPGWPLLGIVILAASLYRKWRALPAATS